MTTQTPATRDGADDQGQTQRELDAIPYSHKWLSTPWPWFNVGFAALIGVGIIAFCVFDRHYGPGDKVLLSALLLFIAALDLIPAVWTLRHREESHRYIHASSRNWYRNGLRHPYLTILVTPLIGFVYGFGRGLPHHGHASVTSRLAMGAMCAVIVAAIGVFRVVHAKRALRAR
ncbi:hypothetical protein acdb102_45300 [Acidothermaceae bacterium B102]|nr:hypothetical protein acdb102_45300 [Acidothermaceae bacterium B102]